MAQVCAWPGECLPTNNDSQDMSFNEFGGVPEFFLVAVTIVDTGEWSFWLSVSEEPFGNVGRYAYLS